MVKPLVIVKWNDAYSPLGSEVTNDENLDEAHKPLEMLTVGWLLRDNVKGLTLCAENCGDGDFRNRTFIPRSLVVSIHRLSRSKKLHEVSHGFDDGLTAGS